MMREFEIERQFGLKIDTIKPNKGVYFLKTDKGNKCLKRINYGIQKLLFVYGAKEHLLNNGFDCVDKYDLNIDGDAYALVNEDIYTLSQWIEGRECNFTVKDDILIASKALARLHEASKGYEPPENSKLKTDIGRWPALMDKRIKALDKMRDMARKRNQKTEFDLTYIKNYEKFKTLGIKARGILEESAYLELCELAEEEKGFCHHDYTYHNIIIDDNQKVHVIDFDYSKREIRSFDIANFMIKVLKRGHWDIELAKEILEAYNSVSELRPEEYKTIFAFLTFPQRFWRLSNRYYYNEVNWGQKVFIRKINGLIDEQEEYLVFIEKYRNEILKGE